MTSIGSMIMIDSWIDVTVTLIAGINSATDTVWRIGALTVRTGESIERIGSATIILTATIVLTVSTAMIDLTVLVGLIEMIVVSSSGIISSSGLTSAGLAGGQVGVGVVRGGGVGMDGRTRMPTPITVTRMVMITLLLTTRRRAIRSTDLRSTGSDLAMSVQTKLTDDGYYHGQIDGVLGSDSLEAIRQFQSDHELAVNGKIDPKLLDALGIKSTQQISQLNADAGSG
jgi:Putative peptidoglycan binding domain